MMSRSCPTWPSWGRTCTQQMRAAVGDHPLVGEIRGTGFMIGIELVKDRATKRPFPRRHSSAAACSRTCSAAV